MQIHQFVILDAINFNTGRQLVNLQIVQTEMFRLSFQNLDPVQFV